MRAQIFLLVLKIKNYIALKNKNPHKSGNAANPASDQGRDGAGAIQLLVQPLADQNFLLQCEIIPVDLRIANFLLGSFA